MQIYVALLRGINVSGQKKIKMTDLKLMFENLGFKETQTYIQSGNVVFKADEIKNGVLEEKIAKAILKVFGFDVPVLVKTKKEIETIVKNNPFQIETEEHKIYFVLLKGTPEQSLREALLQETYENETFVITNACIYLDCEKGYGNAKCNNNFFERKLKVPATTRNFKTMQKLIEMLKS